MRHTSTLLFFIPFFYLQALSQSQNIYQANEIFFQLKKTLVLGNVLYIAAHPDDENTRLLAYLSNEKLLNTAYLSLTRGDGGQNLIGPEIQESLGIIRTQELLEARKVDRGKQFFTSARDFGYSKSANETLHIWNKEKVLSEMVWIIRKFCPDVIITRFSPDSAKTHGHHTASALLAKEAFLAAGDVKRFPEQLQSVLAWQPSYLFWNTSWWFYGSEEKFSKDGLISIDVGGYNKILGKSYTEIAALSRSKHKSQGFGTSGTRGEHFEYFEQLKGEEVIDGNLFATLNIGWSRVDSGQSVKQWLDSAMINFDIQNPSVIIPDLIQALKALKKMPDHRWKEIKIDEIKNLIQACLGLYLDANTETNTISMGDTLTVNIEAINRSGLNVKLLSATLLDDISLNVSLLSNKLFEIKKEVILSNDQPVSRHYWLKERGTLGNFKIQTKQLLETPQNPPAFTAVFKLLVEDEEITYSIPIQNKTTDPIKGEISQPLVVVPKVTVNLEEDVLIFSENKPKKVALYLKSWQDNMRGKVSLNLSGIWKAQPVESDTFYIAKKGEKKKIVFELFPPIEQINGTMEVIVEVGGQSFNLQYYEINYDHINNQIYMPEAKAKLVKLDIKKVSANIGYIMGAGDQVPKALNQMGYEVEILDPISLELNNLKPFDVIILGIRSFNVIPELEYKNKVLWNYVKNGGTLIMQYNTSHRLVTEEIAPYSIKLSRDRVSVEQAPVEIINSDHRLLNIPNKITEEDFKGWIQERGLYFPNSWDNQFETVISCHDPGESPKSGGLLIAEYGKGYYIYSGYSWFRQLPAGVDGAYRLFANMIAIGKK